MKSTDIHHLRNVQYKNLEGLKKRWKTYEYLKPHFDIYSEALQKLNLKGTENILEVGCGDGGILTQLANKGHGGKLIGLDIHDNMFVKEHDKVEFVVGDASELSSFPDESFDVVLGFFMVYHMPEPLNAIREWMRVLKKGGKLVVTAATKGNKIRIKAIKDRAADTFGIKVQKLTDNCTFEKAVELIDSICDDQHTNVYKSEMHIPEVQIMMDAVESVRDTFHPDPNDADWERAKALMSDEISGEIKEKGYFLDLVERGLSIATKK